MKKWMSVFVLFLIACSQEVPLQQQSAVTRPPEPVRPRISYYEGTHAADAIQQVRAKVGEPFRVLNIRIDEDSVRMQVQDPRKKENVDQYVWDEGVLKPAAPVRLVGRTDQETLEANLFDPATVDLTKLGAVLREANEKVQLEGRELSGITIERNMFDDSRPIMIDVNYRGTRKHGYLRTDRNGAHPEVRIF